jgi:tRNA-Thr(GGU) m(6)t(6)A37 methyltransferase TsaA
MKIEYRPIGVVRSPFTELEGTPTQPSRARGVRGTVEVLPELAGGLSDLDGFSHVVLISHLHRSVGFELEVVPHLDTERRGVFATRSPRRPNPIGLSVVRLVRIEGATLTVENLDLLDGTPVLDIKPYLGGVDDDGEVRTGWLETARARHADADEGSFR